jgi:hypothetical protein
MSDQVHDVDDVCDEPLLGERSAASALDAAARVRERA